MRAQWICDADVENNALIGEHGMQLIKEITALKNGETVQVLTHCNAGWLATVDRKYDRTDICGPKKRE
ncbi:MAG: hypothetical protein R2794_03110 [Chitinophagales bacterium]